MSVACMHVCIYANVLTVPVPVHATVPNRYPANGAHSPPYCLMGMKKRLLVDILISFLANHILWKNVFLYFRNILQVFFLEEVKYYECMFH